MKSLPGGISTLFLSRPPSQWPFSHFATSDPPFEGFGSEWRAPVTLSSSVSRKVKALPQQKGAVTQTKAREVEHPCVFNFLAALMAQEKEDKIALCTTV